MKQLRCSELVLNSEDIAKGVARVASNLNRDYTDAVLITVVPGGIFFCADLARQLRFPVVMDYLSCPHTPGERENLANIVFHDNTSIDGKDVLLVDDAIESGGTMARVVSFIQQHYHPKSIATASLLVRKGRVDIPVAQYFAHELAVEGILVGYGLPWDHQYRNLDAVYKYPDEPVSILKERRDDR